MSTYIGSTEISNAYIGIPYPESITLDKSSISLTTIGQTEQLTATIEPTISDHSITWSSDDTTVATVSTTGLITCVTPGSCTITATTVNGLTASCSVDDSQGWQPGVNTLLYLPLESDVVDQSGQATTRTFTTSGLSYTTVGGVPSVHMGTTGGIKLTAPYPLIPYTVTDPVTFSVLIYVTSAQTSGRRLIADTGATGGNRIWSCIYEGTTNIRFAIDYNAVNYVNLTATNYSVANTWIHVLATVTTTSSKLYIDGNLVDSGGGCPAPGGWWSFAYDNTQGIFCTRDVGSYTSGLNGNARELIIENKEWTAQEVVDYYTRIKAKLGI